MKTDFHPLGFLKVTFGDSTRLHVWDDHVPDTTDIHQHRASFTSTVLAGSMNEELWRYADDPDGAWERAEADCWTDDTGHYHVDPRGPWVRCRAEVVEVLTHKAGETYVRDCRDLHRVFPVSLPLVTLVETGPVVQKVHTIIRKREDEGHGR